MRKFIPRAALIVVALAGVARADFVTFSDGTFSNSDWSITNVYSTGFVGTPPTGGQVAAGGNPGSYRRVDHLQFTSTLISYHMREGAVYTPSVQGAVTSMDFEIDVMAIINLNGINVAVGLAIEQNGHYYMGPGTENALGEWIRYSVHIEQQQFTDIPQTGAQPDFSSSGGPIRLGFYCANDNTGVFASRAVGLDNWYIRIADDTPGCPADFDGDGTVDFFDYDAFVACFEGGACPPGKTADFDGDGSVDFFDYDAFVVAFETPC